MSDITRMATMAALLGDPSRANILTMAVAAPPRTWRGPEALRNARTCYDHLAGRLGVAITDSLISAGHVTLTMDGGELTVSGHCFLQDFGAEPAPGKRIFCRPCLDWSERRPHLAGRLGAALATRALHLNWIARRPHDRAVTITPAGVEGFAATFNIKPLT